MTATRNGSQSVPAERMSRVATSFSGCGLVQVVANKRILMPAFMFGRVVRSRPGGSSPSRLLLRRPEAPPVDEVSPVDDRNPLVRPVGVMNEIGSDHCSRIDDPLGRVQDVEPIAPGLDRNPLDGPG